MCYHFIVKREKLIRKAINNARNLRFSEFQTLIGYYGFQLRSRRGKGSHLIYKNREIGESIAIQPTREGKAKSYQVEEFLAILRRYNLEKSI